MLCSNGCSEAAFVHAIPVVVKLQEQSWFVNRLVREHIKHKCTNVRFGVIRCCPTRLYAQRLSQVLQHQHDYSRPVAAQQMSKAAPHNCPCDAAYYDTRLRGCKNSLRARAAASPQSTCVTVCVHTLPQHRLPCILRASAGPTIAACAISTQLSAWAQWRGGACWADCL